MTITESRWTAADLATFPADDGKRYEIIGGELYVSKQPHWHHQFASNRLGRFLDEWVEAGGGGIVLPAPGLLFADDDDVAPDVVWYSPQRFAMANVGDGHLHAAPDLAIEILSLGKQNEVRDREAKRGLYSRRGVLEYWIVDWRTQQVEVYRREQAALRLVSTLYAGDALESPLLFGFSQLVGRLFATEHT